MLYAKYITEEGRNCYEKKRTRQKLKVKSIELRIRTRGDKNGPRQLEWSIACSSAEERKNEEMKCQVDDNAGCQEDQDAYCSSQKLPFLQYAKCKTYPSFNPNQQDNRGKNCQNKYETRKKIIPTWYSVQLSVITAIPTSANPSSAKTDDSERNIGEDHIFWHFRGPSDRSESLSHCTFLHPMPHNSIEFLEVESQAVKESWMDARRNANLITNRIHKRKWIIQNSWRSAEKWMIIRKLRNWRRYF